MTMIVAEPIDNNGWRRQTPTETQSKLNTRGWTNYQAKKFIIYLYIILLSSLLIIKISQLKEGESQ